MMGFKKTESMMLKHLETQIKFLENSNHTYDNGFEEEAQRLATSIRVLLHDTDKSISLLKHLDIKTHMLFISSAGFYFPSNLIAYTGLCGLSSLGKYVPLCNMDDKITNRWHKFNDWWNEIIIDDKTFLFSRKDIILLVSNKEGGAHVDDVVEQRFANLHYDNSIGWVFSDGQNQYQFTNSVAYASIRQIAHELQISINTHKSIKSFTRKKLGEFKACYIGGQLYFIDSNNANDSIGSKLFNDSRVTRMEDRVLYSDRVIFDNLYETERLSII